MEKELGVKLKVCSKVEVLTVAQVLNFEDEMVRSTDISKAEDLTYPSSLSGRYGSLMYDLVREA